MSRFAKILLVMVLLAGSGAIIIPLPSVQAQATTGTFTGRVTSASQPGGVKNVLVYSYDLDHCVADIAYTDASGNYTLENMETGSFVVRFETRRTSTAYLDQWYAGKGSFYEATPVQVTTGLNSAGINVVLQPGTDNRPRAAVISGTEAGSFEYSSDVARYLESKGYEVEWLLSGNSKGDERSGVEWKVIEEGLSTAKIIFYVGHGIYYGDIPNCRVGGFFAFNQFFGYPELSQIDFDENAIVLFANACFTAGEYNPFEPPSTEDEMKNYVAMYANDFMGWQRGDYYNYSGWHIDYGSRNLGFALYHANNKPYGTLETLSMMFSADYGLDDLMGPGLTEDPYRYNDESSPGNPMQQDYRIRFPESVGGRALVGNFNLSAADILELNLPSPTQVPYIKTLNSFSEPANSIDGVYIAGERFGEDQGGSYVTFGSVPVSEYFDWNDWGIKCKPPSGVYGNMLVTVQTSNGSSNSRNYYIAPPPPPPDIPAGYDTTFYFAEGCTREGFQEYLCLSNPTGEEAGVQVVYLYSDGHSNESTLNLPANSRFTIDVNANSARLRDVSIRVASDQPIVAERPMYFSYNGLTGGHDVIGATSPATTWYFAEGYTGPGFDQWICVLNPGDDAANLTFRFQTQEEGEVVRTGCYVPAHSRSTFKVNDVLGPNYQCSLKLESTRPVVAERPIYFDYLGTTGERHWDGGHCVIGATSLADSYYFAEGTTRDSFEEWLTLQNPNPNPISIDAVYQLGKGQGTPVNETYLVGPGKRYTVCVPAEVGGDKDVSVQLSSTSQFLAERPMYFNYDYVWTGGHCVIGSSNLGADWFFAEGYTGEGFHEWLCLQNPGDTETAVEITYLTQEAGALPTKEVKVPANTRVTVRVNDHAGSGYQLSTRLHVKSGPGIVAERPMYFNYNGAWDGGHDVVGYQQ